MADNNLQAKGVFDTLCAALDHNDWKYTKDAERLCVEVSARGEDLPMELVINVDAKRELVVLMSRLPVSTPEDKRVDLAVAVAIANNGTRWGNFDYNVENGQIFFRMAGSYMDSLLGEKFLMDMVLFAFSTIDRYNDRFLMLAKDMINIEKFIELDKK